MFFILLYKKWFSVICQMRKTGFLYFQLGLNMAKNQRFTNLVVENTSDLNSLLSLKASNDQSTVLLINVYYCLFVCLFYKLL